MVTDSEDLDGIIEELNARARAGDKPGRVELLAAMGPFVVAREVRRLREDIEQITDAAADMVELLAERLFERLDERKATSK